MAYDHLEPIPDPYHQTGLICSTLVNLWSKTRTRPDDFIPRVKRARAQDPREQIAIMQTLTALQAARAKSMRT